MSDTSLGAHPSRMTSLYGTSYATGDKITWLCFGGCAKGLPGIRSGVIYEVGPALEVGAVASCPIGVIKAGGRLPAGAHVGAFKCATCHWRSTALFPPDENWVKEAKHE